MTTEDVTPEALLARAADALTVAETIAAKAPQRAEEWALVAQAASHVGTLALEIAQTRLVSLTPVPPEEGDLERIQAQQRGEGNYWLSAEEWETILALRVGAATVHVKDAAAMYGVRRAAETPGKAPESPTGRLPRRRGGVPYPRDLDQSDVDADAARMEDEQLTQPD